MAAYYHNPNNERGDAAPVLYLRESLPISYQEAPILSSNVIMDMNSNENLQGTSNSVSQQPEILLNLGGSQMNEMLVMQSNMLHNGQNLQGQGLSLSLGTQILSGIHMPSISYQNSNPWITGEDSRNAEYLPPGFSNKGDLSSYGMSSNVTRAIPNSKYLKAAHELLDEVVNVRKALKQSDREKNPSEHENAEKSLKEAMQEASSNSPTELSHAERQDIQNKMSKLLSMLDEVDRRYKQYYHEMQLVVSSFDVIAGCGAAKPYTALALQTISRHFRCLRDAITNQIKAARKSLGEQDSSENSKGIGITRLRFVDQQLRQQRAVQQLGMMQQHTWRPQRGLPENSVSILRAWLFEHFLHPYPKDCDKIMLARQTGLTRGQVSNWFINARVRLWKPMVEEMYKEEAGDAENESNSSSETATRATKDNTKTSESASPTVQHGAENFVDSNSDKIRNVIMIDSTPGNNFQNMTPSEIEPERFMETAYHMSDFGRFGSWTGPSGVSLTLGLQNSQGGNNVNHDLFTTRGGYDIYGGGESSTVVETSDFECVNDGGRQRRYSSSSQLLHDFVA